MHSHPFDFGRGFAGGSARRPRWDAGPQPHDRAARFDNPLGFGFGPGPGGRGYGFGFGAGQHGRRGPGRRGQRGDVRSAILILLTERPMHGYEMIQEIAGRSKDLWRPSPGSVYPTLQLLVDEGLIVSTESTGSKKLFELTADGRAAAEKVEIPPWETITDSVDPDQVQLANAVKQLLGAAAQSVQVATGERRQRIVDIVNTARREIYTVLGESE